MADIQGKPAPNRGVSHSPETLRKRLVNHVKRYEWVHVTSATVFRPPVRRRQYSEGRLRRSEI